MRLQEICDKIKLRHDNDDDLLGGLNLSPFEDMILWQDLYPIIETSFEPLISMGGIVESGNCEIFNSMDLIRFADWPATFADVLSKTR